jgi:hypothetical protein
LVRWDPSSIHRCRSGKAIMCRAADGSIERQTD